MYKATRTGESRRVKRHASFLCIRISGRMVCGLLFIVMLCSNVMCGCGKKDDAVYIAAEEESNGTGGTESTVEDDGTAEPESADGLLYVYVCGAVGNPGLYALEGDSRVYDAIVAAGGLTADACPDYWNQAAYVSDGQMIDVPTQTEVDEGLVSAGSTDSGSATSDGSGSDENSSGSTKININTATQEELMTLSGIGEARAAAIISYRQEHGSFSSIEDIKNVSGIGDALYEKICDEIVVD